MKIILAVGTGSFIGGISRYLLSQFVQSRIVSAFPFATLTVNLIGCFLIGVVFAMSERLNINAEWRFFLITGVLGGFTTFSAFSYETLGLLRIGMIGYAATYVLASVFIGVLFSWTGYSLFKLG